MNSSKKMISSGHAHAKVPFSIMLVRRSKSVVSWSKEVTKSSSSSASQTYKNFDYQMTFYVYKSIT